MLVAVTVALGVEERSAEPVLVTDPVVLVVAVDVQEDVNVGGELDVKLRLGVGLAVVDTVPV